MSKYCPIVGRKVVYLECLECESKKCEEEAEKPVPARISKRTDAPCG